MKRIKLFAAALVAGLAWAGTAFADSDVTSTYLTNAGFDDQSSWQTGNVAAGGTANSVDVAGWTNGGGAAWSSSAAMGYIEGNQINSAAVPSKNSAGGTDGGALGLSVGWGGTSQYTQTVSLPAGNYRITYAAYNAGTTSSCINKIGVSFGGTDYFGSTTFTLNTWVTESINFDLTEETSCTFSVGLQGVSDVGSGGNAKLLVDYLKLEKLTSVDISALESEITTAKSQLATYEAGTAWYTSLNEAITTAEAAKTSVKTANEVTSAVNALKSAETAAKKAYNVANAPFKDGEYLLQNVETGSYLGGGVAWGTRACLSDMPQWFGLALTDEGAYTLDSHQYNNATSHFLGSGDEPYCDSGATGYTFSKTETDGVFTISLGGKYLTGVGNNAGVVTGTDATVAAAQWKLISKADIVASQANASKANPVDVTGFILDPQLKRNANTSYYPTWTITGFDGTGTPKNFAQGQDGNYADCAESYHSSNGFKATQTIKGLKAGIYQLTAQGFYRQDDGKTENLPYIYAGNAKVNLPAKTGDENNMVSSYAAFLAGNYKTDAAQAYVLNEGGDLEIGIAGEATSMWNIFGQFRLSYLGEINFTDFIVNADLTSKDPAGFDATGTKGIDGTGQVKAGSDARFDFKQTITIPAGQYKLTAQAAYRYGGSEQGEYDEMQKGTETHLVKLYATVGTDETSVNVKNRWEGATDAALAGTSSCVNVNSKYVPNSSADVLTYMKAGQYDNEVTFNITEEGPVTIGVKKEAGVSNDYTNIGAWTLTRLGDADPTAVIKSNIAKAEAVKDSKMQASVSEALATAITNANAAVTSGTGIAEANTALKTAIADANTSIANYATAANMLPEMKKLTETTNVYSADTYNTYYGQWVTKYDEGTLTNDEAKALANPNVVTGWHASTAAAKLLLPAWKIGDTQCEDFNAGMYINTWSKEGESDGSGFKVPFFEYWTNDGNSLGANTLTATLNNVPAGKYEVSAWVRVRIKNDVTDAATGITLQANDGTAVDACAGEQIGETQFRLMEVKAKGTVGEDGVLAIKFNVAAENNISWLSFKNVKYAVAPTELVKTVEFTYQDYSADYPNYEDPDWGLVNGAKITAEYYDNDSIVIRKWMNQTGYDLHMKYNASTGRVTSVDYSYGSYAGWAYCAHNSSSTIDWYAIVNLYNGASWVSGYNQIYLGISFDYKTWYSYNLKYVVPSAVAEVSEAKAGAADGKYIKNGQVIIVKNGKQYTAAGAQLK